MKDKFGRHVYLVERPTAKEYLMCGFYEALDLMLQDSGGATSTYEDLYLSLPEKTQKQLFTLEELF